MLKCWCFMRLNTAGIVIGWLGLIGTFILTIVVGTIMGNADVFADNIVDKLELSNKHDYDDVHMILIVICSVYLAICLMNLLISSMLLFGIMKQRHMMLLPWLIIKGIYLIIRIIYSFFLLIVWAMYSQLLTALTLSIISVAFGIYQFLGIYSLFKQIQRSQEKQRPLIYYQQATAVLDQGDIYHSYIKI